MANGVNKVILIGNLGDDPELKYFENGGKIAKVSLATTESYRDRNSGERVDQTEWHRVEFNDKLAGIVEQYLKKGSTIYVEGKLKKDTWQDKNDGSTRSLVKIRGLNMVMLDGKGGSGNNAQSTPEAGQSYNNQASGGGEVYNNSAQEGSPETDDLPF